MQTSCVRGKIYSTRTSLREMTKRSPAIMKKVMKKGNLMKNLFKKKNWKKSKRSRKVQSYFLKDRKLLHLARRKDFSKNLR